MCLTWLPETEPMARFEVCRKDEFQENDLEQNGYAQHKKLGETEEYVYYLSWNESGNEQAAELLALLPELASNITVEEPRKVDDQFFGVTTPEVKDIAQVGQFQTATLDGETVDQSVFLNKKLIMINVWTTWCGSCLMLVGALLDRFVCGWLCPFGLVQDLLYKSYMSIHFVKKIAAFFITGSNVPLCQDRKK